MTHSIFRSFTLLTLLALALSAPAAAQSPSLEGYAEPGGQVQSKVQGQGSSQNGGDATGSSADTSGTSRSAEGGSLPFTGVDIGWFGAAGLTLLLVGFALRRLTAPARLH